ncbi:hypothetical protein LJC69_04820 [Bacteroidales bacterium OttesenSCG-928-K22]|nr:hypothetical protein [Bacteroidales bacterium OttesenSCG-928-K22]
MNFKNINILILILLILCSCSSRKTYREQEKPIARVYDKYLYPSDIIKINDITSHFTDSTEFTDAYIGVWIKNQLMLQKAESNLTKDDLDIDKLIKNYRQSLVIFTYEQKVIEQKLDTIVTEFEIQHYYENNKSNFELRQNILKASYVITKPKVVKNQATLKKWLMSEDDKDIQELIEFCNNNAEQYYISDNNWLYFNDFITEIPIKNYNEELFFDNNNYIFFKDSDYDYYIYIKDFMAEESISPLEFEKANIANIIINTRKKILLQHIENELYNTALKNNEIEIY